MPDILDTALYRGHEDLAKRLLDEGLGFSKSVLISAVSGNCVELAKLLIERGADVNARDIFSETPLTAACLMGSIELACLFIDHGADMYAENDFGDTPLDCARIHKYVELEKVLKERMENSGR